MLSFRSHVCVRRSHRHPRALACARFVLGVLVLGCAATHVQATTVQTYCVSDSFQLADVLSSANDAVSGSMTLDIRIRQGTYAIGTTKYAFSVPATIRGGYSDLDCTARNANPYNTIIDLSGGALTLTQPKAAPRAKLAIDGVTIRNGTTVGLGAGTVNEIFNDDGDLTVVRTRFSGLTGSASGDTIGLSVATGSGFLENVLIDHVSGQGYGCALALVVDGSEANFGANYVTADMSGSVCLATGSSYYVSNYFDIENSIFWNSGPGGLPSIVAQWNNHQSAFYFSVRDTLVHTVYDTDGNPTPITGQVDADPKWLAPATGSYDLGPGSPALNVSFAQSSLGLPSNDMIGQARNLGPAPDLGALESNGSTVPTYVVSNTNDSGAGSLRQAILDANKNPLDQSEIIFQLPGGCPQVIALASPLPDIASPVRIAGYSQAGAAPNIDPSYFFPTLCVLLKSASGTLSHALRVPASAASGALDVSGLGFGGFTQPIVLLGGTPHRIAGNQFGGNYQAIDLPGAGLNAISVGLGSTGSVTIGGPSAGERNMISDAANGSGINIQSSVTSDATRCRIVNNIIGANQDYSVAVPNGWGINLAGSGCLVQDNRIVGNLYDGIWINSGMSNYIRRNVIGVGNYGGPLNFNQGWGIRVTGSYNVIGSAYYDSALTGTANANTIAYMLKGGVSIESPFMVVGNAVRANLIHDNGVGGYAPVIDLGGDGPTANDAGDADSGANELQNYAKIIAVKYTYGYPAPGAQNVSAYLYGNLNAAPGVYRIDGYFYNGTCQAGQRGQAAGYLGTWPAVIAAGGSAAQFNYQTQLPNVAANAAVAFTATDANGNTSELGECYPLSKAVLLDDIFKDGYE